MNRILVVVCAAVLSACVNGTPCDPSSPNACAASSGTCHPQLRICVSRDAGSGGGTGGGTTGGGGGTVGGSGGSDGGGGGMTGGGGGGAACDVSMCNDGQECGMAGCQNAAVEMVVLTQPTTVGLTPQQVSARIQRTGTNGDVSNLKLPMMVSLTPTPGVLMTGPDATVAMDGTFSFVVSAAANANSAGVVGMRFGAQPVTQDVMVTADTAPPGVTVEVESRPTASADADPAVPGAWKKTENALVKVTVNGGRAALASDLQPTWPGMVATSSACTACSGDCRCFEVELAQAPVKGMRSVELLQVRSIADSVGNMSAMVDAGVNVTRYGWQRAFTLPAGVTPLPVAVTASGVVVWGATESAPRGSRLRAEQPDGTNLWSVDAGVVTAGPALTSTSVWAATDVGGTTRLQEFSAASGTLNNSRCSGGPETFTGTLAVAGFGSGTQVVVGVRNGELSGVIGAASTCWPGPLAPAPSATAPISVVALTRGATVQAFVVSATATRLWQATLSATGWALQGFGTLPGGTQPRGLFLDGANFVGGGGGVVGNGNMFVQSSVTPIQDGGVITTSVPAFNSGPPVLSDATTYYGDNSSSLFYGNYTPGSFGLPSGVTATGDFQGVSPVVGAGGSTAAKVYFISSTGVLVARDATNLAADWSATLSGTAPSEMALDTLRVGTANDCSTAQGRQLGILYVVTKSGATATLNAVIVDSPGLDRQGRWPKFQHDNANSGSSDTSLNAWSCP